MDFLIFDLGILFNDAIIDDVYILIIVNSIILAEFIVELINNNSIRFLFNANDNYHPHFYITHICIYLYILHQLRNIHSIF